jgi:hypothetical protein
VTEYSVKPSNALPACMAFFSLYRWDKSEVYNKSHKTNLVILQQCLDSMVPLLKGKDTAHITIRKIETIVKVYSIFQIRVRSGSSTYRPKK